MIHRYHYQLTADLRMAIRGFTISLVLVLSGIVMYGLFLPCPAEAAQPAGRLTLVEGRVDMLRQGALPAEPAKLSGLVYTKDVIRTKSDSRAEVAFSDGSLLKISQRSRLDISEYVWDDPNGKRIISLPRGKIEAHVSEDTRGRAAGAEPARFEVHTPNAVAGVRGTIFKVWHVDNITGVLCEKGLICVGTPTSPDKCIMVQPGYITFVGADRVLHPSRRATPNEIQKLKDSVVSASAVDNSVIGFLSGLEAPLPPSVQWPSSPTPPQTPPVVEVGRTTLSGALVSGPSGQLDFISVIMKNVIFLAPSTGQPPTLWNTGDISGAYHFGPNIVNGVSSIPVSNGRGITGNFNIGQWGNNNWSGSASGQGNLSGGSYTGPVNFQGGVNGMHTGGTSGSFAGTGSGTASK